MGTSMGGQASMNLLLKYPHLFGGVAGLSPYFAADTIQTVQQFDAKQRPDHNDDQQKKRIYLDIGGDMENMKVPWFDVLDHLTPAHWWNPGYFWLDTSLQRSVQAMHTALSLSSTTTNQKKLLSKGSSHDNNGRNFFDDNNNDHVVQYRHFHYPLLHLLGGR
jgi:S-formylglutathione hydrolase FrmB